MGHAPTGRAPCGSGRRAPRRARTLAARDAPVDADRTHAAPSLAAALVAGGTVRVTGWPTATTQPGAMVPELLETMGATSSLDGDVLTVTGTGEVRGVDVDLPAAGELAASIAARAARAAGARRRHPPAVLVRRPHVVGWLVALAAIGGGVAALGGGWRSYASTHPGLPPLTPLADAYGWARSV